MSERAWYRSLYWRIGLGVILFLGVLLLVQAVWFLWILTQRSAAPPIRPLSNFVRVVASDLGAALEREPALDIEAYVRERYEPLQWPLVVVMADGRTVATRPAEIPEPLLIGAGAQLRRRAGPFPEAWGPDRMRRFAFSAPVRANNRVVGLVMVRPGRPAAAVLRESAPVVSIVAVGLLILGSAAAALAIFRPAHRRLRGLEDAARRLGAGETAARAPEDGGDEIAAVARAFNRMANDLTARAEELRAADRARRQLLADVSHELMTPLTAMRGYLETLAMPDLPLDGSTRSRYLEIVREETLRMERMIGDLLDLSRLEAGGVSLNQQRVATRDLLARVAKRHELAAREKGVEFAISVDPGAEVLNADPDRLEQALQNLAANALRHSSAGGRVELRASLRNGSYALEVRDTGEGIASEHLSLIFDRFYKADASRCGISSGSGLGLSIAKAIVERHGGVILASSRPGVETTFEIRLPRRFDPGAS